MVLLDLGTTGSGPESGKSPRYKVTPVGRLVGWNSGERPLFWKMTLIWHWMSRLTSRYPAVADRLRAIVMLIYGLDEN